MTRINMTAMASQLQAMGFSAAGARQLSGSQIVGDIRDRQRLALFLAGLLETNSIRSAVLDGKSVIQTGSGIVIDFSENGSHQGSSSGVKSSTTLSTVKAVRTKSGIVVSFEDE